MSCYGYGQKEKQCSMITHDHKLIFIHIPKCAGRSVADTFDQRFDHFTATYYEKEYRMYWNEYSKFAIIRNPYARLVSIYTYCKAHRRHSTERISALKIVSGVTTYPTFTQWIKSNIEAYNSSTDVFDSHTFRTSAEGLRGYDGILGSPFWFNSQTQRLKHNIGRIELFKIEDGVKDIEQYLSDKLNKKVELPHSNQSSFRKWQEFYDQQTYDLVSLWNPIMEDCSQYKYKF